jgi:acetyl-CoA C-acetyltransferase
MKATIIGAASTSFGELWGTSPRALAATAVHEALIDAGIEKTDVEAVFVGNMLSGMLGGQEHLGTFFADELGMRVPAMKIEGACASGGLAVHAGIQAVLSGMYETVLVLGVEKMTDHKPEDVAQALTGAGTDEERGSGITFPGLYAIMAKAHMHAYGTTEKQLASVAVKNHFHATFNPKAQFRKAITVETVLNGAYIADPLHLLDCSPISDGASAIIITSRKKKGVQVVASAVSTDSLGLSAREHLTTLHATVSAATKAYKDAHITPGEIQVAEIHDCFTIAEIMALADLGFTTSKRCASELEAGDYTIGSGKKLITNTSGGLKACGHPIGATGVKQIVEIVDQLLGRCGQRQVTNVRYGLTHNVGGSGGTAVVHILTNQK